MSLQITGMIQPGKACAQLSETRGLPFSSTGGPTSQQSMEDLGRSEMSRQEVDVYTVVPVGEGCSHCNAGEHWDVVFNERHR